MRRRKRSGVPWRAPSSASRSPPASRRTRTRRPRPRRAPRQPSRARLATQGSVSLQLRNGLHPGLMCRWYVSGGG